MSVSAAFWREVQPLAERCLRHPFVQGLGDGTLPSERYRHFIAQDAYYLEVFARGYAHCLARTPDREGVHAFRRLLNGVFDELSLHRQVADDMRIDLEAVDPAPATLAYTGFLTDAIAAGVSTGDMLAAMTPCMRLYAYLGQELAREPVRGRYAAWVERYASEECHQLAALVESLLDRHAPTPSDRAAAHYRRAMELEYGFFEGAWAGAPA